RRQFRSAGIALWYRAVRRSFAQRAISGVFDVVHATRRGEEGTERRSGSGWRQGGVIMAQQLQFTAFSRLLHWTMAIMVLAMLFIGIGMVASLSNYHWLISIHKPLGILILILVAIRLVNRLLNPAPPLPQGMPAWQRFAAHGSHVVLYALLFALPL